MLLNYCLDLKPLKVIQIEPFKLWEYQQTISHGQQLPNIHLCWKIIFTPIALGSHMVLYHHEMQPLCPGLLPFARARGGL